MRTDDVRTIDGYRVEIALDTQMSFPEFGRGADWSIDPGIAICVYRPEVERIAPDGGEMRRRLYGRPIADRDGYEGQYGWPTAWDLDRRRYVRLRDDALEEWLTPHIARAVTTAKKRDTPILVAVRPVRQYQGPDRVVAPTGPELRGSSVEENEALWEQWGTIRNGKRQILDRNIRGWEPYNAIIRVTNDDMWSDDYGRTSDYLAEMRYLHPPVIEAVEVPV